MLTGTDLKDIKYTAAEVIRKGTDKASAVECGLYMGILTKQDKNKQDKSFLVLVNSKSTLRMYNLDEYDIVAIDVMEKSARYLTVFTKEAEDQTAAQIFLNEVVENLEKENRLYPNDPNKELIDIDTYEDYPSAILTSDNLTGESTEDKSSKSTTKSDSTTYSNGYSPAHGNNTTNTTKTTTYQAAKPKVFSIKRKGKLPKTEKLDTMKDKVRRLASGDFELTNLPIPECDKEDKKSTQSEKTTDNLTT